MKNKKLTETELYLLEINLPLSLVYLVFKRHASDGELRQTILLTVDVARNYHLKHIMINSQSMDYVDINDQQWIATQFTQLVAAIPECELESDCKIIGILPSEATHLLAGYTIMEKAKKAQDKPSVEIQIFTDVNTALLSLDSS